MPQKLNGLVPGAAGAATPLVLAPVWPWQNRQVNENTTLRQR
jgi:hypothetical protein